MKELFIATGNPHKIREIKALLAGLPYQVRYPDSLTEQPQIEETGLTFTENALIKARAYRNLVNCLIVGEDSGLAVTALAGFPGIYSARWLKESATAEEKNQGLLSMLEGKSDRSACFTTAVALLTPDGKERIFVGQLMGSICTSARGLNGFGYDPIFLLPQGKTLAELNDKKKNTLSHRAIAFGRLREFLESYES